MNVHSVVGVRPEFVMAAPVLCELAARGHESSLTHTGQHHDEELSETFFDELPLRRRITTSASARLPATSRWPVSPGRLVPVLAAESPTVVVVYGDTTSTLAGAISAVATGTVLVHVEAGLRSGDWQMPEERTRVIVDHLADLRLAPTVDAVSTLADEGVIRGVRRVGDVRADAVALSRATGTESAAAAVRSDVPDSYVLATVHRQSTTDDGPTLRSVIDGLGRARRSRSCCRSIPEPPTACERAGRSIGPKTASGSSTRWATAPSSAC